MRVAKDIIPERELNEIKPAATSHYQRIIPAENPAKKMTSQISWVAFMLMNT